MKKQNQAFTLVELIVVITILAILGTIAFISLQGYSKDTRNSVRLSDLSNIDKMLGIKMVTVGKVPFPDDYVEITASGTVLNYQGEAGAKVLETLGVFNGGKDPKDETYYTYSTDSTRTKYELLGFLEGDALANNTILGKANAVTDLTERQIKVKGQELGIILDSVTNIPVTTNVDVVNTTDTYKVTFSENDLVEGTGATLFSNIYNRNENLLNNKELAKLDDSLVGYWDMETMNGNILKDLSENGNDGILVNGVDCSVDGISGKTCNFDGIDDRIDIDTDDNLNLGTENFSISTWIKINNYEPAGWGDSIVSKINALDPRTGYDLRVSGEFFGENANKIMFWMGLGHSSGYTITGPIINDNLWHHIVAVIDRQGFMFLYVDSFLVKKLDISSLSSIDNSSSKEFMIGQSVLGASYTLNGSIDEVRTYNRALSDEEISTLYNTAK